MTHLLTCDSHIDKSVAVRGGPEEGVMNAVVFGAEVGGLQGQRDGE